MICKKMRCKPHFLFRKFIIDKSLVVIYNTNNEGVMNFDKYYKIINDDFSGQIKLKSIHKNALLPYVFDYIDLTNIREQAHSIVKVSVDGQLKLLDLRSGKLLDYTINKWNSDGTDRFVTMNLRNGDCAVYDCLGKKMRILPKNIFRTYVSTYNEDNYILVQLQSGEYTFYHLSRYFTLDVRYSREDIQKLGGKLHWKDVVRRSPKDFGHLPMKLINNKSVVNQCVKIFNEILKDKKKVLTKEDYLEFKKEIVEVFNKRVGHLYNNKQSEKA